MNSLLSTLFMPTAIPLEMCRWQHFGRGRKQSADRVRTPFDCIGRLPSPPETFLVRRRRDESVIFPGENTMINLSKRWPRKSGGDDDDKLSLPMRDDFQPLHSHGNKKIIFFFFCFFFTFSLSTSSSNYASLFFFLFEHHLSELEEMVQSFERKHAQQNFLWRVLFYYYL